jgi:serine protease Do
MKKLLIILFIFFQQFNCFAQEQPRNGFADIVADLLPAVVNISTAQKPKDDVSQILNKLPEDKVFDQLKNALQKENLKQKKLSSLGSGFIISKDGYVVTKYHVIENASEITISLNDGRKFTAKVVGVDKNTDTTLLKINSPSDLPFVKFGDSTKSRIGDWVIVIGNPFGLGGSVSVGIISARGRDDLFGQGDFLQTDAAINRGNSGGPLFNTKGEVIGIATAIFSTSGGNIGIGFAITSESALPIINQLKDQGAVVRGWIGVSMQEVSEEMTKALGLPEFDHVKGALITNVIKGGAAEKAGILPSDIIVKFDGKDIEEMKMLPHIVSKTEVGKKVKIVVIRQGKHKTLTLQVQKMPDDLEEDQKEDKPIKPAATVLGIGLADFNEDVYRKYNLSNKIRGIAIVEVDQSSKAAEAGLLPGDVILSVNQTPVKSVKSLQKMIVTAIDEGKEAVMLLVKRQDKQMSVVIEFL